MTWSGWDESLPGSHCLVAMRIERLAETLLCFDAVTMQDPDALLPNGGRKPGQSYVNNFFFFPRHLDGELLLSS